MSTLEPASSASPRRTPRSLTGLSLLLATVATLGCSIPQSRAMGGELSLEVSRVSTFDPEHVDKKRQPSRIDPALVDVIQAGLIDHVPRKDAQLMAVLEATDATRGRLADVIRRIEGLEKQARKAGDDGALTCLEAREKRARDLRDAAEKAYVKLLSGISEDDVLTVRQNLEVVALLPRLEAQLMAQKDACVFSTPGRYIEGPE